MRNRASRRICYQDLEYFGTIAWGQAFRLYLAYYQGKVIAGTIAILYGNKCWYLYGANINGTGMLC